MADGTRGLSPSPTLCRGAVGEGGRQPPAFRQGPGAAAELHGRGSPPAPHRLEALGMGAGAGREVTHGDQSVFILPVLLGMALPLQGLWLRVACSPGERGNHCDTPTHIPEMAGMLLALIS